MILWIAAVIIILSVLTNSFGKTFYAQREKRLKVFDIGARYLPNYSQDKFMNFYNDGLVMVFPFLFGGEVVYETFMILPMILLLRAVFNLLTILPKNKDCDDTKYTLKKYMLGQCYDKIFSGHFSTTFLVLLILLKFKRIGISHLLAFSSMHAFLILSLRRHYTVDIAVAVLATLVVFQNKIRLDRF